MAAIKKSVRLVGDTIKTLHQLTESGEINYSGAINSMSERYNLLIDDNTPDLNDNEWATFYCAFNGYAMSRPMIEEASLLYWHIDQAWQYDEQVRDLLTQDQVTALIERVKTELTLSQRLAIIHKARAYWRQGPLSGNTE